MAQRARLVHLCGLTDSFCFNEHARRAVCFIEQQQNDDGAWGARLGIGTSIEETAAAIDALAAYACTDESYDVMHIRRGLEYVCRHALEEREHAEPIGLYFARLWYYEKSYAAILCISALRRVLLLGERL